MGVQNYLAAIASGGGVAKSNLFMVWFEGLSVDGFGNNIGSPGAEGSTPADRVKLLCDEVTLPGVQSNTGSITRYSGAAPRYYPTNPIYTDTQLSFICDAKMTQLKFLNAWRKLIYNPEDENGEVSNRLQYPKDYQCTMSIQKTERSASSDVGVEVLTYKLYNAWPYAVDSIPLSYGSSQLVKVTANFYYTHWKTFNDAV